MTIALPEPIVRYFAADRGGAPDVVAACFTAGAIVQDERRSYTGRDAIRRWKADAASRYSYTAEPFACVTQGDRTIVTSHLVGDFPGSPVDLRYAFALEADMIARLEIVA